MIMVMITTLFGGLIFKVNDVSYNATMMSINDYTVANEIKALGFTNVRTITKTNRPFITVIDNATVKVNEKLAVEILRNNFKKN